jgi:N-methylhydantoinase A/oxoprolinase/acetone carboxylase beta subunit
LQFRVGVDIGGTFTDFAFVDTETGAVFIDKKLTTPREPERAVLAGIEAAEASHPLLLRNAAAVSHATTLATNVVLERKGACTGLLTTSGFRDILEIGREVRYDVYDLFLRVPEPLVPRPRRLDIRERVYADGRVLVPLVEEDVRAAAAVLRQAGVEAVAVVFLHAYCNPAHELRAAEILGEELPGVALSLSHQIHPQPKEYERTSTTVADAYIKPSVARYLGRLEDELHARGYRHDLLVMQSNGGSATAQTAKHFPIQMIESGPAAGVEAAAFFGRIAGLGDMLSFDMGGTTAKLCLIRDGKATRTRSFEIDRTRRFKAGSGIPVAIPVYDLLEIGAGGGSIARINSLGLLQVGPDSAGSEPGPVCYGRGGTELTVTDADLALGYLDPDFFLGGEMKLHRGAVLAAMAGACEAARLDQAALASGIYDVVNETMASAARIYVAEKGQSPADLVLVAFGGAGPVHAVALARKLGCPCVVIPPMPGVMSSVGLLAAPIAFERTRSVRQLLAETSLARLNAIIAEIKDEAARFLPHRDGVRYRVVAEMRYAAQDYALDVDAPENWSDAAALADVDARFRRVYEDLYGRTDNDNPIELVALRIQAMLPAPPIALPPPSEGGAARPKAFRRIYDTVSRTYCDAPVFERAALGRASVVTGPAIIEERESTTVIHAGDRLTINPWGCLMIELAPTQAAVEPTLEVAADA